MNLYPLGYWRALCAVLVLLSVSSCQPQSQRREYEEVVIGSPQQNPHAMTGMPMVNDAMKDEMMKSVSKTAWQWVTPQGWQEKPGSAMRLATFTSVDAVNPIECTIVSLSGQGGGFEANVRRWMGQINISFPTEKEFQEFLSKQEKLTTGSGLTVELVDFTLAASDPQSQSMLASIITLENEKVFIKMTGQVKALEKNREPYKKLCTSLKQK